MVYDDGESFAAGDDTDRRFDNDELIELFRLLRAAVPDPEPRRVIRLAILAAVFGEAVDL